MDEFKNQQQVGGSGAKSGQVADEGKISVQLRLGQAGHGLSGEGGWARFGSSESEEEAEEGDNGSYGDPLVARWRRKLNRVERLG